MDQSQLGNDVERGRKAPFMHLSASGKIWLINGLTAGSAAAIYFYGVKQLGPASDEHQVPWWVMAIVFYIAEVFVVHLQFRRNASSFSLNEIPRVFGLFFVAPQGLVLAQLVGAGAALVLNRKQSPMKVLFNLSLFFLQTSLAIVIFRSLAPTGGPLQPEAWGAAFTAQILCSLVAVLLFTAVISVAEGEAQYKTLPIVLGLDLIVTITNTCMGLIGAATYHTEPRAAWLLIVPAVTLYLAYRGYASQREKHESLEFLYEATRVAQRSLQVETVVMALLSQARKMFSADIAEITFFPGEAGEPALRTTLGPGERSSVMQPVDLDPTQGVWARVASEGEAILLSRPIENERLRSYFAERNMQDAMVAPLHGEHGAAGKMVVANRLSDVSTFDYEDLRMFETLVNHASVSLENARLVATLEESLAHLTEMNRLKDDFVAAVSHELRTPLTSIQGYVKTLLRPGVSFNDEQQQSFLEVIDRQSARLRNLIEDLLVVSRLESHQDRPVLGVLSLPQVVQAIIDELKDRADERTFSIHFDPDLPIVTSDERKIHQILSNLIDNAMKYGAVDGGIAIRARKEGEGVAVSVCDGGPGIPSDQQDRIFERFYQVDQSSTRPAGGTGLGLYICRRFADAIGGRVWLEKSDGGGSVFSLWIPAQPGATGEARIHARLDDGRPEGTYAPEL